MATPETIDKFKQVMRAMQGATFDQAEEVLARVREIVAPDAANPAPEPSPDAKRQEKRGLDRQEKSGKDRATE